MSGMVSAKRDGLCAGREAGRRGLSDSAQNSTAFRLCGRMDARCLPGSCRGARPAGRGLPAGRLAGWRDNVQMSGFMLRRMLPGFDWQGQ